MNIFLLSLLLSLSAFSKRDISPDSPMDSSMEEVEEFNPEEGVEQREEVERKIDILENPYEIPSEKEEEEYKHNGR